MLCHYRLAHLYAQNDHFIQARLNQLKIFGNERISANEIQGWLKLKKGASISQTILRQRGLEVLERLQEKGFYFAKIDSITWHYTQDSTKANVSLYLAEGDLLRVGKLNIKGLPEADQILIAELRTRPGQIFYPAVLREDVDFLIRNFERKGFPYCQVHVTDFRVAEGDSETKSGCNITLEIIRGPQVSIDEIEIQGNEQTKAYVIERESGLREGEIYDQQKIDKVVPKLMRLGYFKWVNPPKLEWRDNGAGKLIIELAEGNNNRFDGVVGYNPPAGNNKGFVTGLVNISFRNLLGTGRQIEAHWERRAEETQELQFRYVEPWVAGLPINLGLSFQQLIQDTSYVQRSLGLEARLLFNENLSFFSGVSKRDVSPDSLGVLRFGIPPSTSTNLTVGLNFNTLDHLLNPTKGVRYQTSFEWSKKNTSGLSGETGLARDSDSFSQKRLSLDFETYVSPFRWQVLALGLHGRQITSNDELISITDQYRFGGSRTLRGYREEQFRGSRIAWVNAEYRYLLDRESRLFLFFDAGYFFREELADIERIKIEKVKVGIGLGLRIDTKLGYFGIDYGLGQGDSLSTGKVHIGLTNAF